MHTNNLLHQFLSASRPRSIDNLDRRCRCLGCCVVTYACQLQSLKRPSYTVSKYDSSEHPFISAPATSDSETEPTFVQLALSPIVLYEFALANSASEHQQWRNNPRSRFTGE